MNNATRWTVVVGFRLSLSLALGYSWTAAQSSSSLRQIINNSCPDAPARAEIEGWYGIVCGVAAQHQSSEFRWVTWGSDQRRPGTQHVERRALVISWFMETYLLAYVVDEEGQLYDYRLTFQAAQASRHRKLANVERRQLRELLARLPVSKAEPPLNRTIFMSFQADKDWRTETYDVDSLPPEFEKVIQLLGERFETKDRHKKP